MTSKSASQRWLGFSGGIVGAVIGAAFFGLYGVAVGAIIGVIGVILRFRSTS